MQLNRESSNRKHEQQVSVFDTRVLQYVRSNSGKPPEKDCKHEKIKCLLKSLKN